jgi:hypothetical protein
VSGGIGCRNLSHLDPDPFGAPGRVPGELHRVLPAAPGAPGYGGLKGTLRKGSIGQEEAGTRLHLEAAMMEEQTPANTEEVEATLVLPFRLRAKVPEEAGPEKRATLALVKLLYSLRTERQGLDALIGAQAEIAGRRVEVPLSEMEAVKEFLR